MDKIYQTALRLVARFLTPFLVIPTPHALGQTYWETSSAPPQFCFQNFNAYGPIYASGVTERTQITMGYLKTLPKCEVVQLQEVWNESHIRQVENSLSSYYSISSPNKEARIGIMSLVMGDVLERQTRNFKINNSGSILDEMREVVSVGKAYHVMKSQLPSVKEPLYFVNTHLHPTSTAVRITQILDLLQWRLQNQDFKVILSGDFNADIDSVERKLLLLSVGLHDAMEESFGASGYPTDFCTYCRRNPLSWLNSDRTFDYILYSNVGGERSALKVLEGLVNLKGTPKQPLSDHYGVRILFSVQPDERLNEIPAARAQHLVNILREAKYILAQEKDPAMVTYKKMLSDLETQVQTSSGSFYSYIKWF